MTQQSGEKHRKRCSQTHTNTLSALVENGGAKKTEVAWMESERGWIAAAESHEEKNEEGEEALTYLEACAISFANCGDTREEDIRTGQHPRLLSFLPCAR